MKRRVLRFVVVSLLAAFGLSVGAMATPAGAHEICVYIGTFPECVNVDVVGP